MIQHFLSKLLRFIMVTAIIAPQGHYQQHLQIYPIRLLGEQGAQFRRRFRVQFTLKVQPRQSAARERNFVWLDAIAPGV